jgi:ribosome production factor 1
MTKKVVDPSLKGKKPINTVKRNDVKVTRNPGHILNKMKRSEMYGKYLVQKRQDKKERRIQRDKEAEALGEEAPPKKVAKTIDNTREIEPTLVGNDAEVAHDEETDEFAPYFTTDHTPKVLITTRPRPSKNLFYFIADLQKLIPALHFYPRKSYSVKEICAFAAHREFTHLIVLSEKSKVCNGMTISHLRPHDETLLPGPTAFFKLTNVVTSKNIPKHGASTLHIPELNVHGFTTRLGHRVGRLLASLFPHAAQFQGRQVATFHNQRDYVFVRQHRYIFDELSAEQQQKAQDQNDKTATAATKPPVRARLQELGPRFTLKLRWLQEGVFDTKFGEYEWTHKRKEMDTTRRKFHM